MSEISNDANFTFKPTDPNAPNNQLKSLTIPVTYIIDTNTLKSRVVIKGTSDEIGVINGYDKNTDKLDDQIKVTSGAEDKVLSYLRQNSAGQLSGLSETNLNTFVRSGLDNQYYPNNGLQGSKNDIKNIIREEISKNNTEVISTYNKIKESQDDSTKNSNFVPSKEEISESVRDSASDTRSNLDIPNAQSLFKSKEGKNIQEDIPSEGLKYPKTLDITRQDYMKFYCCRFKPQMIEGFTFTDRDKKQCTEFGPVYLPVSGGAQDTNTVSWGKNDMNPLQIGALSAAKSLLSNNSTRDITNYLQEGRGLLEKYAPQISEATAIYFAEQASGVSGLLSRTQGAIFNPNLVLLFNNPEMRSFTLNFKFSARDIDEATSIRRIIRWFKQHMAVRRSKSDLFLLAPDIFSVSYYMAGNGTHKSIGDTKLCALTSCNVNYVPDNSYMTFDDPAKTMTSYQMVLTFNEIEPVYEDEYKQASDVIGY